MNPLQELHSEGQSFWLDYIRRSLMTSGELKRMIQHDGLRGMTSNPTIFEKAISAGDEYDATIKKAASLKSSTKDIFEILAVQDIQRAADILRPVFISTKGTDGFVSLEVSPTLAYDTKGTFNEAKRLTGLVKRPNLMIKIPATPESLPSIENSTAAGLNINITLLFSVENYKQVVEAYLHGLEKRVKKGQPIKNIVSVASFFVSRVDTVVDKMLDQMIAQGGPNQDKASTLLHKAAIANAKVAYAYYQEVIQSERWAKLLNKGANVQRLLWGSTGTKDKRMSDVVYIEELIGPDTVNTVPPQTAEAFKDHGRVQLTLTQGVEQAKKDLAALAELGINLESITKKLQEDGVKSFIKSFDDLLHVVEVKREFLIGRHDRRMKLGLGEYQQEVGQAIDKMQQENWVERIWAKDAALWKKDEAHQKIIRNSLGWLEVAQTVSNNLGLLSTLVKDVKKGGFTHVLLLGMGGSSLAPEVLRLTFGKKAGFPDLAILDSTQPASVLERLARSKPKKTLYIVSSKSGSTTEPNAFLSFFYDQVAKEKGAKAGDNFIAITDPGTQMEKTALEKKFRHVILNPSDIGGRYSALSYFGMVPAALMGISVEKFLERTGAMMSACSPRMPVENNPGALLGAALGALANRGRNKLTLILSKEIESFSTWLEQLIAESTGKEGKGIVPVEAEPLLSPENYGDDRVFVSIQLGSEDKGTAKKLASLEKVGHPVIRITLDKKEDLAGEFFRWEMATAVAGGLMGIDPFDQPNVQESKDITKEYIEIYRQKKKLPQEAPQIVEEGISLSSSMSIVLHSSLKDSLQNFLSQSRPGDYVAFLAYLERNEKNEMVLSALRESVLKSKKVATTVGFGPRFLHSTGQLHKGGDARGLFIQITADDNEDAAIPGEPFSFGILKQAQALGDLSALKNKNRRVVHLHLKDVESGLKKIQECLQ